MVLTPDAQSPKDIFLYEAKTTPELLEVMQLLSEREIRLSECPPFLRDGVPPGKKVVFVLSQANWMVAIPEQAHDEDGYLLVHAFRTNQPGKNSCLRLVDDFPLKIKAEFHDPFKASPEKPNKQPGLPAPVRGYFM